MMSDSNNPNIEKLNLQFSQCLHASCQVVTCKMCVNKYHVAWVDVPLSEIREKYQVLTVTSWICPTCSVKPKDGLAILEASSNNNSQESIRNDQNLPIVKERSMYLSSLFRIGTFATDKLKVFIYAIVSILTLIGNKLSEITQGPVSLSDMQQQFEEMRETLQKKKAALKKIEQDSDNLRCEIIGLNAELTVLEQELSE